MADIKAIKELALYAAKKQVPAEFANKSVADVNEALRKELKAICGTYDLFRRNKLDLFEIMQESIDAVVPAEVMGVIAQFAEVKTVGHGDKTQFKIKKGKLRARKFATRATASGVYETFRLDTDVIDVNTFVIGDAAYIDFERFLSGDEDWADYMEALMDGILHKIYSEIFNELHNGASLLGSINKIPQAGTEDAFNADSLLKLVKIVRAYGDPVIVATTDYISAMGDAVVESAAATEADKEDLRNYGRLLKFRGIPVVELPVSYTDETNTEEVFGGKYAFVLPSNGEKIIKVIFEGNTVVKDWENRDNSMEIQAYKKMGVAIVTGNNWGIHTINEKND
jgi:hypothetical protein